VEEGGDSSVEKKKLPFLELLRRMQGNEEDEELNKELGQLVSTCKSQIDDGGAYGRTALHLAAEGGLFGVAGKLIAAGANVSAEDTFGNQALHLASLKGHDKLASLLLEKGARLEAKDRSGLTPLMKACFSDKPKVVELLLGKGADVLASDEEGSSPLHLASLRGSDQIVRQLLEKDKSNIEATTTLNKETALHLASERGNAEVVSRLIDAGAVLNPQTSTEWTPLHLASIYGHAEVVSRLLDAGAVLNPHTFTGWTPLHLASIFGHVEVVSRLIDAWAEPNEQTIKQESFLRVPSESSYAEVGSRLLNIRDRNGKTALHLASGARDGQFWSHMAGGVRSQGRLEAGRHNSVLRLLLEQGAKLEITDNGEETALHLAARHGDPNRIKTLLKAQDMDEQVLSARNNKSQTALFVAFRGDKPENAMRTLLESKTLKIVDFGAEGLRLQVIQKLAKNPATHDIVARIFGWKAGTDSDNAVPSAIKGAVHERLPDVLSDLIDTSPDNEQKNNALETAFNEVLVVVRERNQRLESSYSMEANMSQSWNRINKNPLVDAETSSKLGESQGSKQGQLTQETIEQDESQQLLAILELLILNSPRTPQVEDNLKVSLLSTLGLVKTFVPRDERERLLNVLWHLISAAEPASDIKEKISEAISAVKKLTEDSKSLEQTNSTQDWEQDASNSHGPGSTDNTEAKDQEMGDNQDITDHNMQQTKQIDNDAEEYQRYLKTLEDILHNPFVRLRTHREKKTFQRPRAMLGDESILENYDITITQFLTGDVEQISRRYRSVKEVIYDEGPNHCTAKPFLGPTNTDQKSEPKVTFTWIHLPATNVRNCLLTARSCITDSTADSLDECESSGFKTKNLKEAERAEYRLTYLAGPFD
jgi:ankyrin repeat protein